MTAYPVPIWGKIRNPHTLSSSEIISLVCILYTQPWTSFSDNYNYEFSKSFILTPPTSSVGLNAEPYPSQHSAHEYAHRRKMGLQSSRMS